MLPELSPCDREDIAHKAEVISYLALHRKSLPIHILEESPFNIIYAQSFQILLELKKMENAGHFSHLGCENLKNNTGKSAMLSMPRMAKSRAEGNNPI